MSIAGGSLGDSVASCVEVPHDVSRFQGDGPRQGALHPPHRRDCAPGVPHPVPAVAAERSDHRLHRRDTRTERPGARLQRRRTASHPGQCHHARDGCPGARRSRRGRGRPDRSGHVHGAAERQRRRRDVRHHDHRVRTRPGRQRHRGTDDAHRGHAAHCRQRGGRERRRRTARLRHRRHGHVVARWQGDHHRRHRRERAAQRVAHALRLVRHLPRRGQEREPRRRHAAAERPRSRPRRRLHPGTKPWRRSTSSRSTSTR